MDFDPKYVLKLETLALRQAINPGFFHDTRFMGILGRSGSGRTILSAFIASKIFYLGYGEKLKWYGEDSIETLERRHNQVGCTLRNLEKVELSFPQKITPELLAEDMVKNHIVVVDQRVDDLAELLKQVRYSRSSLCRGVIFNVQTSRSSIDDKLYASSSSDVAMLDVVLGVNLQAEQLRVIKSRYETELSELHLLPKFLKGDL
jgi:hypothetical protein